LLFRCGTISFISVAIESFQYFLDLAQSHFLNEVPIERMDTIHGGEWLWLPVVGDPETIQVVTISSLDGSYRLTLDNPSSKLVSTYSCVRGEYEVVIRHKKMILWRGRFWRS